MADYLAGTYPINLRTHVDPTDDSIVELNCSGCGKRCRVQLDEYEQNTDAPTHYTQWLNGDLERVALSHNLCSFCSGLVRRQRWTAAEALAWLDRGVAVWLFTPRLWLYREVGREAGYIVSGDTESRWVRRSEIVALINEHQGGGIERIC